jgi:hypothetical protein
MAEGTSSWCLAPDASWTRHHLDSSGVPLRDLQTHLIRAMQGRAADA